MSPYEEYANLSLGESNSPCPVEEYTIIRNCTPSTIHTHGCSYQIIDPGVEVNAANITGIVENIYTNSGTHYLRTFPILRHGDYLYLPNRGSNSSPYISNIAEYNLLTEEIVYMTIGSGTNPGTASDNVTAAIIDNRKLFVADASIGDVAYIMDFETETVSEELDMTVDEFTSENVITIKDETGDIHLIAYGDINGETEDYCGIKIFHKNYTASGAWIEISLNASNEGADIPYSGYSQYYTIVNNKYIVIFSNIYYSSGFGQGVSAYVFDIENDTLDYTSIDYGKWEFTPNMSQISVDNTNNKCYLYGDYYDTDWYGGSVHVIEFDPATMTYSQIYTSGPSTTEIECMTSNTHSYFYDEKSGDFYQSSNQALKFNYSLPSFSGHDKVCFIIDDGDGNTGELLWYVDTTTKNIYSLNMNGNIEKTIDVSSITFSNYTHLFHLGDKLLLTTYKSTTPYFVEYYLIT